MMQHQAPAPSRARSAGRRPLLLAAALALFALLPAATGAGAAQPGRLSAALLTRDLGDPRAPGNVKLVLTLPENLAHRAAAARAGDFAVYVYPLGLSRDAGMADSHKAGGLYLWRSGQRIFIDARVVPIQDREGPAEVRVVYAPTGEILAEGVAEGVSRYASELVDVILAVDVSGSMAYNDPRKRRVAAARTFIEMAREGGGIGRVGLVTFNHQANVTSPLAPLAQGERLLSALAGVGAEGLTNLDSPLRLGMHELFRSGSKRPVVILLTDGKNEGSRYQNTHLECAKAGVRLFTVGLTESADHQLLKEMADATGGIYFRAPTDADLPEIYARLAAELGKRQLLHAERLRAPSGQMALPIDATVKRLVAMADGGARLSASGPGGGQSIGRAAESVYLGRPAAGSWNFSWSQAAPNVSALALFGDTQFFLDVFPPQLRGGKLAVGATLAQGVRPLANARVWVEPMPGVTAERIALFDDGRHGDGQAGDGVYGAMVDVPEAGPDRFDLTFRSAGSAWDKGEFVRQAVGLTIRSREPPPPPEEIGSANLEGDIDFGVLFPGETGTALAKVNLDAKEPRELFFELSWKAGPADWPTLSSQVEVEPGKRSFELEMRIPESAEPGDYRGEFAISDGGDLGDTSTARVRVGTVRFADPGEIDLGAIPPGTFAARKFKVTFDADKAAPLAVEVDSDGELTLASGLDSLPAGKGEIPLEARVSVPIGKAAGEYFGRAVLRAGPGSVEIPFRWRVPKEISSASLDGDIDFGVLFPGETGTALAKINLDAREPRELFFELSWKADPAAWPRLSSSIEVEPGKRSFELEMRIPESAEPGDYRGEFSISDGGDLGDKSTARVKVGTVRFADPGEIDLGAIPPGTFAARAFRVAFNADKAAPLHMEVNSDGELTLVSSLDSLPSGKGEIPLEARVSVPIGKAAGVYFGRAVLRAGPGSVEISFRWRVEAYTVKVDERRPLAGLPATPELPSSPSSELGLPPLGQPRSSSSPLLDGRDGAGSGDGFGASPFDRQSGDEGASSLSEGESPWDLADRMFRERGGIDDRLSGLPGGAGAGASETQTRFPEIGEPKKAGGDSFWSAWWVYLLAALLLLLLLLLLLAYLLYRLGKSALARFLLVSAAANLILLAIFIALLGTTLLVTARTRPTVAVNLVADDRPAQGLTEAERVVLTTSSQSDASASGAEAAGGEASFAEAATGGEGMQLEKTADLPSQAVAEVELAQAERPSAAPLENRERDGLRRRERRMERSESPSPSSELPEMNEPPPPSDAGERTGARPEVGEERLELQAEELRDQPLWSDGEKRSLPPAASAGALLAEAPGMEVVEHDAVVRRADPRGRRRTVQEAPSAYPEPRVEIADPARDAAEHAAPDTGEEREIEPGMVEIRPEPRSPGVAEAGRRPGTILPAGASKLNAAQAEQLPVGVSGMDRNEPSLARGGPRQSRGSSSARSGSAKPEPASAVPGGASRNANANANAAATGGARAKNAESGTGEGRFDAAPSAAPAVAGGGSQGRRDSSGNALSADAPIGSGAAPNPFRGGGTGERATYAPKGGSSGGLDEGRDQQRRGERPGNGGAGPQGLAAVPGGGGGSAANPGNGNGTALAGNGTSSGAPGNGTTPGGSGRGGRGKGAGEGRFDDMADASGLGRGGRQLGAAGSGTVQAELGGSDGGYGLGAIPYEASDSDWRRNERRAGRRGVNVAASSIETESLLIVVGDFARLPDAGAENLFSALGRRLARGLTVEDRQLAPADASLSDTLLATLSPGEALAWSDADFAAAGKYLAGGGHIWLDAVNSAEAEPIMKRLAKAAGGTYGPLDPKHQLSDGEKVGALTIGGKLAAVATAQDWRGAWRYGEAKNGRALRFLVRSLNFFLSGNAETGIEARDANLAEGLKIEPADERIPDRLNGGAGAGGRQWDGFGPESARAWRMPGWSDPASVSAVSDGEGGRALKLDTPGSVKGRIALYRTLSPAQDLSRATRATVDVYYDGKGEAGLSMVFTAPGGGGWVDFETQPLELARGWNRLSFPLRNGVFRPLSGGAGASASLPGSEKVGRAGFFLYRGDASAAVVLFRDLRLHE